MRVQVPGLVMCVQVPVLVTCRATLVQVAEHAGRLASFKQQDGAAAAACQQYARTIRQDLLVRPGPAGLSGRGSRCQRSLPHFGAISAPARRARRLHAVRHSQQGVHACIRIYRPVGSHPRLIGLLDPPFRGPSSNEKGQYHLLLVIGSKVHSKQGAQPVILCLYWPVKHCSCETTRLQPPAVA